MMDRDSPSAETDYSYDDLEDMELEILDEVQEDSDTSLSSNIEGDCSDFCDDYNDNDFPAGTISEPVSSIEGQTAEKMADNKNDKSVASSVAVTSFVDRSNLSTLSNSRNKSLASLPPVTHANYAAGKSCTSSKTSLVSSISHSTVHAYKSCAKVMPETLSGLHRDGLSEKSSATVSTLSPSIKLLNSLAVVGQTSLLTASKTTPVTRSKTTLLTASKTTPVTRPKTTLLTASKTTPVTRSKTTLLTASKTTPVTRSKTITNKMTSSIHKCSRDRISETTTKTSFPTSSSELLKCIIEPVGFSASRVVDSCSSANSAEIHNNVLDVASTIQCSKQLLIDKLVSTISGSISYCNTKTTPISPVPNGTVLPPSTSSAESPAVVLLDNCDSEEQEVTKKLLSQSQSADLGVDVSEKIAIARMLSNIVSCATTSLNQKTTVTKLSRDKTDPLEAFISSVSSASLTQTTNVISGQIATDASCSGEKIETVMGRHVPVASKNSFSARTSSNLICMFDMKHPTKASCNLKALTQSPEKYILVDECCISTETNPVSASKPSSSNDCNLKILTPNRKIAKAGTCLPATNRYIKVLTESFERTSGSDLDIATPRSESTPDPSSVSLTNSSVFQKNSSSASHENLAKSNVHANSTIGKNITDVIENRGPICSSESDVDVNVTSSTDGLSLTSQASESSLSATRPKPSREQPKDVKFVDLSSCKQVVWTSHATKTICSVANSNDSSHGSSTKTVNATGSRVSLGCKVVPNRIKPTAKSSFIARKTEFSSVTGNTFTNSHSNNIANKAAGNSQIASLSKSYRMRKRRLANKRMLLNSAITAKRLKIDNERILGKESGTEIQKRECSISDLLEKFKANIEQKSSNASANVSLASSKYLPIKSKKITLGKSKRSAPGSFQQKKGNLFNDSIGRSPMNINKGITHKYNTPLSYDKNLGLKTSKYVPRGSFSDYIKSSNVKTSTAIHQPIYTSTKDNPMNTSGQLVFSAAAKGSPLKSSKPISRTSTPSKTPSKMGRKSTGSSSKIAHDKTPMNLLHKSPAKHSKQRQNDHIKDLFADIHRSIRKNKETESSRGLKFDPSKRSALPNSKSIPVTSAPSSSHQWMPIVSHPRSQDAGPSPGPPMYELHPQIHNYMNTPPPFTVQPQFNSTPLFTGTYPFQHQGLMTFPPPIPYTQNILEMPPYIMPQPVPMAGMASEVGFQSGSIHEAPRRFSNSQGDSNRNQHSVDKELTISKALDVEMEEFIRMQKVALHPDKLLKMGAHEPQSAHPRVFPKSRSSDKNLKRSRRFDRSSLRHRHLRGDRSSRRCRHAPRKRNEEFDNTKSQENEMSASSRHHQNRSDFQREPSLSVSPDSSDLDAEVEHSSVDHRRRPRHDAGVERSSVDHHLRPPHDAEVERSSVDHRLRPLHDAGVERSSGDHHLRPPHDSGVEHSSVDHHRRPSLDAEVERSSVDHRRRHPHDAGVERRSVHHHRKPPREAKETYAYNVSSDQRKSYKEQLSRDKKSASHHKRVEISRESSIVQASRVSKQSKEAEDEIQELIRNQLKMIQSGQSVNVDHISHLVSKLKTFKQNEQRENETPAEPMVKKEVREKHEVKKVNISPTKSNQKAEWINKVLSKYKRKYNVNTESVPKLAKTEPIESTKTIDVHSSGHDSEYCPATSEGFGRYPDENLFSQQTDVNFSLKDRTPPMNVEPKQSVAKTITLDPGDSDRMAYTLRIPARRLDERGNIKSAVPQSYRYDSGVCQRLYNTEHNATFQTAPRHPPPAPMPYPGQYHSTIHFNPAKWSFSDHSHGVVSNSARNPRPRFGHPW